VQNALVQRFNKLFDYFGESKEHVILLVSTSPSLLGLDGLQRS
jgi:hypothetical protein